MKNNENATLRINHGVTRSFNRIPALFSVTSVVYYLSFILLFSFITVSCSLVTNRADILRIIDEEVAWAHAKPLTVTVAYPQD